MPAFKGLLVRLRAVLRRDVTERELSDEIRFHLDLETEQNLRLGMSRDAARRQALVAFGGVERWKESHRDVRGARWLEDLVGDVRFALRTLGRNPVLAGAAILTLALGIGANTAIFSAVNAVILRPLPFPHPERLVMLSEDNPEKSWRRAVVAPANYLDWKERVGAFEEVAAYTPGGGGTIVIRGEPQRVLTRGVTGNYFSVLGVRPEMGRVFRGGETWLAGTPVAMISHRLWKDAFVGDPAAVGRIVPIDGTPTEIVGVMPPNFRFAADSFDVWQAMGWDPQSRTQDFFRRAHWLRVIARLKPGVTPVAADAEFQTVVRQLQTAYPLTNRVMGADLVPLHAFLIGDVRTSLLMLQVAVGLLLLIACANVGNLLLVQAVGREREVSLRLTLGAGRGRLVRQVLTESLVLSALGGVLGCALGWWGTRTLAALQPSRLLPVARVPMDLRVLASLLATTTATGLLFGSAPALWIARRVPAEVLKSGGRTGSGYRLRRWGDPLVVGEIALALMLTLGAGLLVRSFWRLQHVESGIDPRGVLVMGIRLPTAYHGEERQQIFFDGLRERVRALPGVDDAAEAIVPPFGGVGYTSDFHVAGRPPSDYGTEVARDYVTPEYFRTLRIPLRAGRAFTDEDRRGSVPVVVINDAMARRYFHGQDPVGQRITFDRVPDSTSVWRTIVGVVGDVRQQGPALEARIEAYEAFAQQPNSYMTLLVRTRGDPAELAPAVRRALADLDATLAPSQVTTLAELRERSIASQRFLMTLLLALAVTGFVLAIVGVYGAMAQMAKGRTREMGIRMALGARASQVQWMVLRYGTRLAAAGLLLGVIAALAVVRTIRGLLFDVAPTDPLTFVGVPLVLALTVLAASWLPAVRASRANPASTLREE
jgi:putative ABC transport system permease protein